MDRIVLDLPTKRATLVIEDVEIKIWEMDIKYLNEGRENQENFDVIKVIKRFSDANLDTIHPNWVKPIFDNIIKLSGLVFKENEIEDESKKKA